jgi:hypothetical protein
MSLLKEINKSLIYFRFLYMKFRIKKSDNRLINLEKKLDEERNHNTKLSKGTIGVIEKYKNIK